MSDYEELFKNDHNMPKRPKSHELDTEAKHYLRALFPFAWIIHESKIDYGEDLRVEIFSRGRATGLEFLIQLKSRKELVRRIAEGFEEILIRIETKTINYLLGKDTPAMIVVYDANEKRFYYVWIREYIENPFNQNISEWSRKKSISIRIPSYDFLGSYSISDIVRYLFFNKPPHVLEPLQIIGQLAYAIDDTPFLFRRDSISAWLKGTNLTKFLEFLDKSDVNLLMNEKTITWDDIYALMTITEIESSTNKSVIEFAKKMILTLIKNNELDTASETMKVLTSKYNTEASMLSLKWWQKWLQNPEKGTVLSMICLIPDSIREECINKISLVFQSEKIENYQSIGFESFGNWLWDNSRYEWHKARALIDILEISKATKRRLLEMIDDWEIEH